MSCCVRANHPSTSGGRAWEAGQSSQAEGFSDLYSACGVHLGAAADLPPGMHRIAPKPFTAAQVPMSLCCSTLLQLGRHPVQHPQSLTGMAYTWKEPQTWMTTMMLAMHTTQMGPLREYRIWSPAELPRA